MKRFILYIAILALSGGCSDVLDISPTNSVSEDAVKDDPVLMDAFLAKVYKSIQWQVDYDKDYPEYGYCVAALAVCAGEHNVNGTWQSPFGAAMDIMDEEGANWLLEYWPYGNIRSANEIIEMIAESTVFTEEFADQKTAEARFLRAYMYFELVKRYGGVPIITVPQDLEPVEDLYVSRNSEKEVYDFIAKELDEIADMLPNQYDDASEFGRATKWAALALKSRAMLYAGSIAKYGTVQLDGLLGFPGGEANTYYQKAYDAANEIITESHHALYNEYDDPTENYQNLFTDDGNSEVIFAEVYDLSLLKVHNWNFLCMPDGFRTRWGSNHQVYLEFVEKYEYQDGTSGDLDDADLDGNTLFDLDALMHQKDPRFKASVFYPETPWQGGEVHFHKSTVGTHPDPDWPSAASGRNRKSGFLVRKRVDESILLPIAKEDETDWIVFRLGEMYLNAAEAAFEQGDDTEAMRLINIIRDRAGMPDKTSLTVEEVRNERAVELAFEEHHYWDLRRWRIAVETLHGSGLSGVDWVYYVDEGKYSLTKKDADYGRTRTFAERNYYFPMSNDRIADNPNLVESPGY